MRNEDSWQPTKAIPHGEGWVANPEFVGKRSLHVASLEISAYQDVITSHARGDLVDLGAGTAPFFGIYKEVVDTVTCVDWSDSLHDIEHVDILADMNETLPIEDSSFDTVLLADVLEHIRNPQLLIRETSRILRPEGKAIIFVPFMYWLHEEPHDYYRYTEYGLRALVEDAGLSVAKLDNYGGGPDIFVDIAQKMMSERERLFAIGQAVMRPIVDTTIFNKLRQKHAQRFPIGYTLVAKKTP